MGKDDNRNKWESAYMNNRTYVQYYNRLTEIAISMFEWKNLPSSVDARFLELILFSEGMVVFFKDEDLATEGNNGEHTLQVMINGQLDLYRIPKKRRAYGTNGYQNELDETNSVIIFNNYLHTNSMLDIEMYAKRLYEIERTIDVNIKAQKTPLIVTCTTDQRNVMRNLFAQYEGNEPFIFGDKNLDLTGIKVFPTVAPYVADKLQQQKREIYNEALTYLGVSNVNIQKKERLLTDEISTNMGSIEAQRFTRLNSRKEACEKINKMFGTNIQVEYREAEQVEPDEVDDNDEKEDKEDE